MHIIDYDFNKHKPHVFIKSSEQKLLSFYEPNSIVKSSLVNKGNYINGTLEHSVVGKNNHVEEGANLINTVIMDSCVIKKNVTIKNAIITDDNVKMTLVMMMKSH